MEFPERAKEREDMVSSQIESRGVLDREVLSALREVPRHLFVPKEFSKRAYEDGPLSIGHEQTISQPYIVGFMSEAAGLKKSDRVLEVGTGSGYQTAILSRLVKEVYTIEIVEPLARRAAEVFRELGIKNVHARTGDAYKGWPEAAPFDVIFVTAAPDHIPNPLIDQLKTGGRFILPVGKQRQELILVTKTPSGLVKKSLLPVSFVPMTGMAATRS